MMPQDDCNYNTDAFKLVRTGTTQEQRLVPALDPVSAPVDERTPAHGIVLAQAYAAFLQFYNLDNVAAADWQPFFSEDVSAQLAVAAVQDVEYYRQTVREFAGFLNDRQNKNDTSGLRDRLDYLFSCCATLSLRLNLLIAKLPAEIALKNSLPNLIASQLAPALKRLIAYHKGGAAIADTQKPLNDSVAEKAAPLEILGGVAVRFSALSATDLPGEWTDGADWATYYGNIVGDASVYGTLSGTTVFDRANHLATHNLFTSILDQFLKGYARTVTEAKLALAATFAEWDRHEPHYALFLAFLHLFEYARAEANTLTGRHLDLYYREILRLKEKAAPPGRAHLLMELARQVPTHLVKAGELFTAGKDGRGIPAFFANNRDFVANQAKVAALKTVYRHGAEKVGTTAPSDAHQGRIYASPVANSEDGLGAALTVADQSWHPFCNKIYQDGVLAEIKMPEAEVGFAVASHYLFMAEGVRIVTLDLTVTGSTTASASLDYKDEITCLFTSVKGWVERPPDTFKKIDNTTLILAVTLKGDDPPITPYDAKVHGYGFATNLPLLLIKLKHTANPYAYQLFQDAGITGITLTADVTGLRTLAVSNDFGPVDTSKPFQPYGASPKENNALVIGSKEVFQKTLTEASVNVKWLASPVPYPNTLNVTVDIDFLQTGNWVPSNIPAIAVGSTLYAFSQNLNSPVVDKPDFTPDDFYHTAVRHGFARLRLRSSFGQSTYQTDLLKYLANEAGATNPKDPPAGPFMSELWLAYRASQTIALDSVDAAAFKNRPARFYHLAPFGQAEQHPVLSGTSQVYLFPQFAFPRNDANKKSEAELYLGVTGLKPPQNLALLFQVADGTADPRSIKPDPHIHWSYLRGNEWLPFAEYEVEDRTGGLLTSGIVTFAVPRDASAANTLLPAGMNWIRAAIESESDAVCRLLLVAAQALETTFTDRGNDPAFPAQVLKAGTISKLEQPDAAVKKITQPFQTFGGRGKEAPTAFYTRISERLRHKDRAVALWDYERLILEAFPQIYQVKCLNHTHYEPGPSGAASYRELAPGHVTIVTIPDQQFHNLPDPLQPYTSLGLLAEIDTFLRRRLSCFVKLHVKNPQFEDVRVDCQVRFREAGDETFLVNKLREDLTRFLSPWAFPGGGRPSFGGKIYKSVLINFLEELPYVDYVMNFQLFHVFQDSNGVQQTVEKNEVEGSKGVSILVSAKKHYIAPVKPAEEEGLGEKCPCEA